jgi:multiple sugar transport system permease protein
VTTGLRSRRRRSVIARRNLRTGLLFLAPWLIGVLVLQLYPMIATFLYSFTDYNGLTFPPHWVGLKNFSQAFGSGDFWTSVRNTLWWTVVSVPIGLGVALGLAALLNRKLRWGGLFRTLLYLPSMVPFIGAGIVFAWLFNPVGGPVNVILGLFHLPQPGWFISPGSAKPGLLFISLWEVGPTMIIFLAGLQSIPTELYEAAAIDGARTWRRFISITVPMLSPTVFFNLILGMIGAFSFFAQVLGASAAANNTGSQTGSMHLGDPNNSTLLYAVYVYQQMFQNFSFGYGAALSVMLTVVVAVLAGILFRTARRWVFYYGEEH